MHMLFGFVLIPVAVNILYICKCVALVVYPRNGTEREREGDLYWAYLYAQRAPHPALRFLPSSAVPGPSKMRVEPLGPIDLS